MNLQLRDVVDSDVGVFYDHMQEPEAVRMAAFVHEDPSDRAAHDAHWAKIPAKPEITIRTIEVDGDVAGHIASFVMDGDLEVTYWIGQAFWGRGVATAALREFLTVVTDRPLHGRVAFDNHGSRRVLEKCGFRLDRVERGFAHGRGEEIEEGVYMLD